VEHHLIVVDLDSTDPIVNTRAIRPTEKQLQQMDDCEGYVIIDPLTMQVFVKGEWVAIPVGNINEHNGIVNIR
jgi:hypothetical protein